MATIYFATNRNPNHKTKPTGFDGRFSKEGLGDLRFGQAEVKAGKLEPATIEVLPNNEKAGSLALLQELRGKMKIDEADSLVFIHGFNVSFKEALESAGRMYDRYHALSGGKYTPNIFVFSWPSDGGIVSLSSGGSLSGYVNDRHDAEASGYAFARGLMKLAGFLRGTSTDEACRQKVNLIAHSMGNYVLRHALQQAKKIAGGKSLSRIFDNIILTAADEDNDSFEHEHKLALLPDLAQRITAYFNNSDLALTISDYAKGNPDRLGHDGPSRPHQIPAKVVLVDASSVVFGLTSDDYHSYHVYNDKVVTDMIAILQGESSESEKLSRYYVPHANKFKLI
ncbi:alpha/beta hydrolase [Methylomonas sp. LL1]|uniref:alpha/beta hydrolase n=1 Tax=Methylomonas sp. LL1 TaxID=2785785 RepID=UPI0018C44A96|nr:alpha/beta hydrolase [Methylomonas sp. LL1]QPK65248.1 alpha/beta hydrolase [Methylomonas sp. LL1]